MLSIVISSYRDEYFKIVQNNINETIGAIDFEIIKIWNPGIMSISQAYNKGADESKYEVLLFLHEDVTFLKSNWGEILLNHLQIKESGVFGLAGSTKQFCLPIGYETGFKKYRHIYVKHIEESEIQNNISPIPIKVKH